MCNKNDVQYKTAPDYLLYNFATHMYIVGLVVTQEEQQVKVDSGGLRKTTQLSFKVPHCELKKRGTDQKKGSYW